MKYVFILLVLYLLYAIAKSRIFRKNVQEKVSENQRPKRPDAEEVVFDPVCKTYIPLSSSIVMKTEKGDFYFCSAPCRDRFASRA